MAGYFGISNLLLWFCLFLEGVFDIFAFADKVGIVTGNGKIISVCPDLENFEFCDVGIRLTFQVSFDLKYATLKIKLFFSTIIHKKTFANFTLVLFFFSFYPIKISNIPV
jgi:hypothetical protein